MPKTIVLAIVMAWMVLTGLTRAFAGNSHEWIKLDENPETYFYFDKGEVAKLPGDIVRITARVVYTAKGKEDALTVLEPAKLFENLAESRYIYNLDCNLRKSKLQSVTHLSDDGSMIKTVDLSTVTEWEEITPNERLELIRASACSP